MDFTVVGENEQICAARSVKIEEMCDYRRQYRLQAAGIQFLRPKGAVICLKHILYMANS